MRRLVGWRFSGVWAVIFLAFLQRPSISSAVAEESAQCTSLYARLISGDVYEIRADSKPKFRYPRGFEGKPKKHLQFGFESEYTTDQLHGFVMHYAPDAELGISLTDWKALSIDERVRWFQSNLSRVFPENRRPGKLSLFDRPSDGGFLPERLIRDSTGNIEIIVGPFDTLEQWYAAGSVINRLFGAGSMQAMLSVPREAFFRDSSVRNVHEIDGFFAFFSDYDALEKLSQGYTRFRASPNRRTARSFEHPFLGPMTKQKRELMASHLSFHSRGEGYDAQALAKVSTSDDSYKYVGTSAYRPDVVGASRPAIEVRDAHNNFELLFEKVARNTFYLENGWNAFLGASELRSFDPSQAFLRLDPSAQAMLSTVFPNRAKAGEQYTESELAALDVFKNFAWPLRDWEGHFSFYRDPDLKKRVLAAQSAYAARLKEIGKQFLAGSLSQEDAAVQVQGALVTFAHESSLRKIFQEKEKTLAARSTRDGKGTSNIIREVSAQSGPIKDFFPEKFLAGDIRRRVDSFVARHPKHVRLAPDVEFTMDAYTGKRPLVVVSTAGLTEAESKALREDYLRHISHESVSFPLSEGGGHLYSRIGNRVVDYFGWWNNRDYALSSGERLEAVLAMNAEESLRLRSYVANVNSNAREVVGLNSYQGASDVRGTLSDNRPLTGGHNCTSWICTSPIGEEGETLYQLTGATREIEVHTNPGWWTNWLTTGAKADRVPAVFFWTNRPLDQALANRVQGGKFRWDFARH
ncbi:MAG: hypothetical protein RJB38_2069 [Pseudomonadota bacterium]